MATRLTARLAPPRISPIRCASLPQSTNGGARTNGASVFWGLQDAATTFTQQLEEIKARYAARTEILASLDEVRFVRCMPYIPKAAT